MTAPRLYPAVYPTSSSITIVSPAAGMPKPSELDELPRGDGRSGRLRRSTHHPDRLRTADRFLTNGSRGSRSDPRCPGSGPLKLRLRRPRNGFSHGSKSLVVEADGHDEIHEVVTRPFDKPGP